MGVLQVKHGMTLFGSTPKGTCEMCAIQHDPEQPHNRQSLAYQYRFYDLHGRFPDWTDAMAHCSPEIKKYWIDALREKGVLIEEKEVL